MYTLDFTNKQLLKWYQKQDAKILPRSVSRILKNCDIDGSNISSAKEFEQKLMFDATMNQKFAKIVAPSHQLVKLVIIMMRYTTLICSFLIAMCIYAIIRRILQAGIDIFNIIMIITAFIIYMMYPVGDTTYNICCSMLSMAVFYHWRDKYILKRERTINDLVIKWCDENFNVDTKINKSDSYVESEIDSNQVDDVETGPCRTYWDIENNEITLSGMHGLHVTDNH